MGAINSTGLRPPRRYQTVGPPPQPVSLQFKMDLHCAYHQGLGHETDYCTTLRHAIQDLIDQGVVHLVRARAHSIKQDLRDSQSDLGPRMSTPFRLVPRVASVQMATVKPSIFPHYNVRTPFILIPDVDEEVEWYDSSPPQPLDPWRGHPLGKSSGIRVESTTTPEGLIHMVIVGRATCIVFSDDDLPSEGSGHTRPLYISVSCSGRQVPSILLDNGSALNVCPLATAIALGYTPSNFGPSTQTVRAYDSTRREVMSTLEIKLLIGLTIFVTLFQMKFIHDGQVVTVQSVGDMFISTELVLQISHSDDDLLLTGFAFDELQLSDGAPGTSTSALTAPSSPDHMSLMTLYFPNETEEIVQRELTSPFDIFEVFIIEIAEEILTAPAPEIAEDVLAVDDLSDSPIGLDQSRELKIGLDLSTDERDGLACPASLTISALCQTIEYPEWLANVIPVPKKDGNVRVCVDFRDLTRFSRYSQILMAPEDMEKTSFITSRVLTAIERHDSEIRDRVDHLAVLERFFERIRQFRLRLNPKKCNFGVTSGKLVGYMVSERGIEADPDKIRTILDMPAPRTERKIRGRVNLPFGMISVSAHLRGSESTCCHLQSCSMIRARASYLLSEAIDDDFPYEDVVAGLVCQVGVYLFVWHSRIDILPRTILLSMRLVSGIRDCSRAGLDRWRAQNQFVDALATLASMIDIPSDATVCPLLIESRSVPAYCCLIDDIKPDDDLP
ncbi:hypothetical protein CK203_038507 [Vitis vinifera]|uniref:Uncharacterized protein n=1 Tax=Vitis vinifera TaxID=29760 RepID=A0A438IS77_VITVI|nr:hypothetical protein CK203_038507 [Vitis vinifera]